MPYTNKRGSNKGNNSKRSYKSAVRPKRNNTQSTGLRRPPLNPPKSDSE